MASKEKRMLTASNSKLAKIDLCKLLSQQEAWSLLPLEIRQDLYSRLPEQRLGQPDHDPDVNPLKSSLRPFIERELNRWQQDLSDGKEVRKWREDAMAISRQRANGDFEAFRHSEAKDFFLVARANESEVKVEEHAQNRGRADGDATERSEVKPQNEVADEISVKGAPSEEPEVIAQHEAEDQVRVDGEPTEAYEVKPQHEAEDEIRVKINPTDGSEVKSQHEAEDDKCVEGNRIEEPKVKSPHEAEDEISGKGDPTEQD